MMHALVIVACLLMVYTILSWASAPATVSFERSRADVAEARVVALSTQIAILQPTPRPCIPEPPYFSRC